MKRYGYLYEKIYDLDNLKLAYKLAKRNKSHYKEVEIIDEDPDNYLGNLQQSLISRTYTTSQYNIFNKVEGGKVRTIYSLPFYPDRILHHAVMNVCGDFWIKSLIRDTYQSIPGRGTSDARRRVNKAITEASPKYYIQMDVKKFYPSVPNSVTKNLCVDKYIKCPETSVLLYEIIDSCNGLPIGNYLSQIWGNLVLSKVDWYAKQTLGCKHYFRYCDDIVVMGNDKEWLWECKDFLESFLGDIGLSLKPSVVLGSIEDNGLDFCGYLFKGNNVRLRKSIKHNMIYSAHSGNNKNLCSYWGWVKPLPRKGLWDKVERCRYENTISVSP